MSIEDRIKVYTVPEVAKLLNMTPQSVRKYLNEGKIKGTKAGVRWVISEENIKEFLQGDNK